MFRWISQIMPTRNISLVFNASMCNKFIHTTGPSTSNRTYYEILGIKTTATTAEIKEAFLQLSKKYHPDVSKDDKQAHQRFVEINEAYMVLSKTDSRREYDTKLRQGGTYGDQQFYYDPVRERYRRYYEEMDKQRARAKRKPEDPFKDFWHDFGYNFDEKQRWAPPPKPETKIDEKANKTFYVFILTVFTVTIIVHLLQYAMIRQRSGPYEYEDIDQKLKRQWKDVVIVDRPEAEKETPGQTPPSPSANSKRDDRFVDA